MTIFGDALRSEIGSPLPIEFREKRQNHHRAPSTPTGLKAWPAKLHSQLKLGRFEVTRCRPLVTRRHHASAVRGMPVKRTLTKPGGRDKCLSWPPLAVGAVQPHPHRINRIHVNPAVVRLSGSLSVAGRAALRAGLAGLFRLQQRLQHMDGDATRRKSARND